MNIQRKKYPEARAGLCLAKDRGFIQGCVWQRKRVYKQPTAQASLRFWGETKRVKEQLNTPRKQEQRFITEPLVFEVPSSNTFRMQKTNADNTVKAFVTFSVSRSLHQNAFFLLNLFAKQNKTKTTATLPARPERNRLASENPSSDLLPKTRNPGRPR